ncbi:MAG: sodium:calcium antiporter [Candidatus Promineofilum sp.]|nr:sodium:calcium antiporter [Promineifilum sp.]
MIWLQFLLAAAVVVFTANKLAEYGDVIAVRTGLGGLVIGTVLMAAATSLPELTGSVTAFRSGLPDLAAGNFFGSSMINMPLLAVIDLFYRQTPLFRGAAISHSLTAALATLMTLVAVITIIGELDGAIGWVGVTSLIMIGLYFTGIWLLQRENRGGGGTEAPADDFPSLRRGLIGFGAAAAVLILVVPYLVEATVDIAGVIGLSAGFAGMVLLSFVTSMPELLAAVAAVRLGSLDLAVGNLLGSSVFNMFGLALADFFLTDGPFLNLIDPGFAFVGLLVILLINMALIANLARSERRVLFIEIDAAAILVVYVLGLFLIYQRGIGLN